MGLPLYRAPVESDIKGKPAPKSPPTRARSTIRRNRRTRVDAPPAIPSRAARRRLLGSNTESQWTPWDSLTAEDTPAAPARTSVDNTNAASQSPTWGDAGAGSERAQGALRDMVGRMGGMMNERVLALFGERWAQLHAGSNPSPAPDRDQSTPDLPDEYEVSAPAGPARSTEQSRSVSRSSRSPHHFSRRIYTNRDIPPYRPVQRSSLRADTPAVASQRSSRPRFFARRTGQTASPDEVPYDGLGDRSSRPRMFARRTGPPPDEAPYDGLGDRNRSLSPEGDGVWDTLLSSITPDPQPPSVGSSFASASASAVASQSAPTGSSSTSLTGPDMPEEGTFEPQCESGCENSDTEGDEDEEIDQNTLTRFSRTLGGRRSYADVAAHSGNTDDPLEMMRLGGIGGMQRIVRNLARREDIPDEWWAEAGLSRTLSREASN